MEDKVIVVDDLTQDYGHGRGVFDVSFVKKGEVFGFRTKWCRKINDDKTYYGFSKAQRVK